jgi:hypothetical protein
MKLRGRLAQRLGALRLATPSPVSGHGTCRLELCLTGKTLALAHSTAGIALWYPGTRHS